MGISAGGVTLLHMATQQRDRIEAMVLIGTASYFPEQTRAISPRRPGRKSRRRMHVPRASIRRCGNVRTLREFEDVALGTQRDRR